jgi:hypothetical protein
VRRTSTATGGVVTSGVTGSMLVESLLTACADATYPRATREERSAAASAPARAKRPPP